MLTQGLIPYTTAAAMAAAPKLGTNGQFFFDTAVGKFKFIKPDGTTADVKVDGAGFLVLV